MAEDNNIKNYSAADIERYYAGKMTVKEMHAFEKAALDDPFLADALEGYAAIHSSSVTGDINFLKDKLAERVSREKTRALPVSFKKSQWLKAAAMLVFVAGLGWMVYRFAFNKIPNDIAVTSSKQQPASISPDSGKAIQPQIEIKDESVYKKSEAPTLIKEKKASSFAVTDTLTNQDVALSTPITSEPAGRQNLSESFKKETDQNINREIVLQKTESKENITDNKAAASLGRQSANQQKTNFFRGQVTDADKNPLPFANVTNMRDNIGTYADAKGNFILTSPDSILNVQVRSLGFENSTSQLRNDLDKNQVMLQQDKNNTDEIVISNKRSNSSRSREAGMKLEEPEPADGWYNYDTYIANNLNPPEDIRSKKITGSVEVSFEVNSRGEAVNIKIEKSLCTPCDQEAIRIIKQGPKWKKKGRQSRVKVTVPF